MLQYFVQRRFYFLPAGYFCKGRPGHVFLCCHDAVFQSVCADAFRSCHGCAADDVLGDVVEDFFITKLPRYYRVTSQSGCDDEFRNFQDCDTECGNMPRYSSDIFQSECDRAFRQFQGSYFDAGAA